MMKRLIIFLMAVLLPLSAFEMSADEKEAKKRFWIERYEMLYESIPDYYKATLKILYDKPKHKYDNIRLISQDIPEYNSIVNCCEAIRQEIGGITLEKSFYSHIIVIEEELYVVLRNKFEEKK